ncbi:MAG: hypothetical protein LBC96_02140 [Lachnospiraceae bacterium]|nr:hypothetical protein [Lachnospiraceae bacterium]
MFIYPPPPPPPPLPPTPVQIEVINTEQNSRFTGWGQAAINDSNSEKHGKGFIASMPNETLTRQLTPSRSNLENTMNMGTDMGTVALGLQEARDRRNKTKELNTALKRPEISQQPPPPSTNKGIESIKTKSAGNQQLSSSPSENKGIAAIREKTVNQKTANKQAGSIPERNTANSSVNSSSGGAVKGGQSR